MLKKIIDKPALPIILSATVKITSSRSSRGEIISVYKIDGIDIDITLSP